MTKEKIEYIIYLLNNSENKLDFFRKLNNNIKGIVLLNLPEIEGKNILKKLKTDEIVELLKFLDLDEITDILQFLNPSKRNKVLSEFNENKKKKIDFLLRFNPKSAAGLMNIDYIIVSPNIKIKDLKSVLEKHEKNTGKIPTVLVCFSGTFLGDLPLSKILFIDKNKEIKKFIRKIPTIKYNEDQKAVIESFKNNPHGKVVVLDDDNSVLGIIYTDDIIKLLNKTAYDSLRDFAGVKDEENIFDSFLIKVKHRYRWLILNLMTAFLAGFVVSQFEDTISKYVLLAAYLPIIAGMGGNAATQTLAVMVRGIALNQVSLKNMRNALINEVLSGIINGIINGIIVGLVAVLFNQNVVLGFILFLSMTINLFVAGFFGTIIPLFLKKLGKDPATSATIFITTATDICGFFILLSLAKMFL